MCCKLLILGVIRPKAAIDSADVFYSKPERVSIFGVSHVLLTVEVFRHYQRAQQNVNLIAIYIGPTK